MGFMRERMVPTWRALTGGQRSDWWFFAMDHPVTDLAGNIRTLNGWQMFVYCNGTLAVANHPYLVRLAPTNLEIPEAHPLTASICPIKCKRADGSTWRRGKVTVNVDPPLPDNRLILIYENYQNLKYPTVRTFNSYRAHMIPPGFSGPDDPQDFNVFPTAVGAYVRTRGLMGSKKKTKPYLQLARYRTVNTDNGMFAESVLEIT